MKNDFYIYGHFNGYTGEIFYIGKGKGDRYKYCRNRNRYWSNIVKKYGFLSRNLIDNLSEKEAFLIEKYLIEYIGRKDKGGLLCNMTDGGEGLSGFKPSMATLLKKSIAIKGRIIKKLDKDRIIKEYTCGKTLRELCVIFNASIGTLMKYIPKDIRQERFNENLYKNQKKFERGHTPWNKGISCFNGKDNPFYGKKHSKETIEKLKKRWH